MQTNKAKESPDPQPPPLPYCQTPSQYSPWPKPPSTRQPETTAIAQSPMKVFKLLNPKLVQTCLTLPQLFLPVEIKIKSLGHAFPWLLPPPDQPQCFPMWPCMAWWAPFSRKLWVIQLLSTALALLWHHSVTFMNWVPSTIKTGNNMTVNYERNIIYCSHLVKF